MSMYILCLLCNFIYKLYIVKLNVILKFCYNNKLRSILTINFYNTVSFRMKYYITIEHYFNCALF